MSESLYPLSPLTAPRTTPISEAKPEAGCSVEERGRGIEVTPVDRARERKRERGERERRERERGERERGEREREPSAAMTSVRRSERSRGFVVEVEGFGELGCGLIRGFREAALAVTDARALAPQRLVLVAPDDQLLEWLAAWAEDAEQVRRTLTISRLFDGKAIRAVVTILTFGYGVETALAVESVSPRRSEDDGGDVEIVRSGVHLKADIEAALARFFARQAANEASAPIHEHGGLWDRESEIESVFADFD